MPDTALGKRTELGKKQLVNGNFRAFYFGSGDSVGLRGNCEVASGDIAIATPQSGRSEGADSVAKAHTIALSQCKEEAPPNPTHPHSHY